MSLALAVCILTLLRTAIVQASNCTLAPTLRPLPEADIPAQRAALAQLYANTQGSQWKGGQELFPVNASTPGLASIFRQAVSALANSTSCDEQQTLQLVKLTAFIRPWLTPNTSYCDWAGISCCGSAPDFTQAFCSGGPQSIVVLDLAGVGLRGSIPQIFDSLIDLQIILLNDNPSLVGGLPPMPPALASKMQWLALNNTGLRQCNVEMDMDIRFGNCLPNWLIANQSTTTSPYGFDAMLCPGLTFWRPNSTHLIIGDVLERYFPDLWSQVQAILASLSTTGNSYVPSFLHLQQTINVSPALYGFRGCTCLQGYQSQLMLLNATSGDTEMRCVPASRSIALEVSLPVALVGGALLILVVLLCGHKQLFNDFKQWRVHVLKSRHRPGTLTEFQCKFLDKPFREITLCMTDVTGSTALWEWDPAIMDSAIALHDGLIRSLCKKHCGHEVITEGDAFMIAFHVADDGVRFAIELQEALMKLDWHPRLLTHPAAATVTLESPAGAVTVFRGLRVRAVLNTGRPLRIEENKATNFYHGPLVELTEAMTSMGLSGGQTAVSISTYQRVAHCLQDLAPCEPEEVKSYSARLWGLLAGFCACILRRPTTKLEKSCSEASQTSRIASAWQLRAKQCDTLYHAGVPSRAAPAAETVLALDLGMYNMKDFPFVREGIPGGTTLHGLQIMQLLPSHIAPRAYYFGALKHGQASPSFTDSPGSSAASFMMLADPTAPPHPRVTIVFSSPCCLATDDVMLPAQVLRYSSCIRTTLLLLGGYECQESEGVFMIAFDDTRTAVEWAISVQACLLRLPGDHGRPNGLVARIGISDGEIAKITPHRATGKADYFGRCVNRAARLREAASPGQIVADVPMLEGIKGEWTLQRSPEPRALTLSLAYDNFLRLRAEAEEQRAHQTVPEPSPPLPDISRKVRAMLRNNSLEAGPDASADSSAALLASTNDHQAAHRSSRSGTNAASEGQVPTAEYRPEGQDGRRKQQSLSLPTAHLPSLPPGPRIPSSKPSSQASSRTSSVSPADSPVSLSSPRGSLRAVHKAALPRPASNSPSVMSRQASRAGVPVGNVTHSELFGMTSVRRVSSSAVPEMMSPTVEVELLVSQLGQFALKGIAGLHELMHVEPAEMADSLKKSNGKGIERKLQRGKATCLHAPDAALAPERFGIPLLDIFDLPLVPHWHAPQLSLDRQPSASHVQVY